MTMPTPPRPHPRAGGFAIALLSMVGLFVGVHFGQPIIGLLAGIGTGILLALSIWLIDARRLRRD